MSADLHAHPDDPWAGEPDDLMDCEACLDTGALCPWHLKLIKRQARAVLDEFPALGGNGSRLLSEVPA